MNTTIAPGAKFTLVAPKSMSNKVAAIKAIRTLTDLGLKEAKDASEYAGVEKIYTLGHTLFTCPNPQGEYDRQVRTLVAEGFDVTGSVYRILEDLRKLGSQALLQGEDELANEILQLVLAEKLRRPPL